MRFLLGLSLVSLHLGTALKVALRDYAEVLKSYVCHFLFSRFLTLPPTLLSLLKVTVHNAKDVHNDNGVSFIV